MSRFSIKDLLAGVSVGCLVALGSGCQVDDPRWAITPTPSRRSLTPFEESSFQIQMVSSSVPAPTVRGEAQFRPDPRDQRAAERVQTIDVLGGSFKRVLAATRT
jgi:hypothetical protein